MSHFAEQVKHNENFHFSLCQSYSDHYFDWKITCLFYAAYHLVQELAHFRNIDIGNRHTYILRNLNPKNKSRLIQFKTDAFDAYDQLFEYSRNARYTGFTDFETFQTLMKIDYGEAIKLYEYLRKYVISQGVIIA